jgi:hypothetical protein
LAIEKLKSDSPRDYATQTLTKFFRNGVGSLGVACQVLNQNIFKK